MVTMFIRHSVADFEKWKPVYDAHEHVRKEFGCTKAEVFRNAQNPNDLLLVHQHTSREQAIKFTQSPDLKAAMAKAGVTGVPEFDFAE
jgi:quinol monooxygenase YgiN